MLIKIRLTADTRDECEAARDYLHATLGDSCRLETPREGRNPRYAGEQKWFCYGQITREPVAAVPEPTTPLTPVRRRRRSPRS